MLFRSLANLLRPRDALYYGMSGDSFDGVEAARIGFINKTFPKEKLVEETMAIARKIAGKDAHALRATKEGYHFSLEMTWEAAMNYSMAKELELVQRQGDAFRKEGIKDFIDGKYKPGLETHPG